eukprot:tig00000147_g9484.t1
MDTPAVQHFIESFSRQSPDAYPEAGVPFTDPYAVLLADAVQVVATALDTLIKQGVAVNSSYTRPGELFGTNPFGKQLFDTIINQKVAGITGPVELDKNGDRLATFVLVNYVDGQWKPATKCPENSMTNRVGGASISECSCSRGFYSVAPLDGAAYDRCLKCPSPGGICEGGPLLGVEPDFYRLSWDYSSLVKCTHGGCAGGSGNATTARGAYANQCREGFVGTFCATCDVRPWLLKCLNLLF